MQHPFSVLRPEYESLLSTCQVTRTQVALDAARRLLVSRLRYETVGNKGRVPPVVLSALHNRESNANFSTYLGNGEPLNRVTRLVPKGRGPWLPPDAWEKGALDAIAYDHLNDTTAPWTMAYACWKGEAWNGFGPRNHGIHTGYLWAGTNHYVRGKYVADGKWDAGHADQQLGMVPVMLALARLCPDWALGSVMPIAPPTVPLVPDKSPHSTVAAHVLWLQSTLNKIGQEPPLAEDGSFGRRTRAAVREFQRKHGLEPDGLCGPLTDQVLVAVLTGLEK